MSRHTAVFKRYFPATIRNALKITAGFYCISVLSIIIHILSTILRHISTKLLIKICFR